MLNLIDEGTGEGLAIILARTVNSGDVLATLTDLIVERRSPAQIRSGRGSEFVATVLKAWLSRIGVTTQCTETASPGADRLHRVVQRQASGRDLERGGVRHAG